MLTAVVVFSALSSFAQEYEQYLPAALTLIEHKSYRQALDELVKAAGTDSENPKVYATLSLLYKEVKECSLAWKYYEVAKDLKSDDQSLQHSLPKLCKEPKETEFKESDQPSLMDGKLEDGQLKKEARLYLTFPPEQSDWYKHAKLKLVVSDPYWELTLGQMRRVRELTAVTVPWVVVSPGLEIYLNQNDGWMTIYPPNPAHHTQP